MQPTLGLLLTAILFFLLLLAVVYSIPADAYYQNTDEDPLMVHLERLAECESGDSMVIHFDDGAEGLHSFYWLQFQIPTFYEMADYYGLHLDIANREHQFLLAYKMHRDGYANRWKRCNEKLGYL